MIWNNATDQFPTEASPEEIAGDADFTDLDDFDSIEASEPATVEQSIEKWNENESAQGAIYEEPCKKCRGSGNFVSYSGRIVGPCFTCNGTGTQTFKTSPETRANRRAAALKKKAEAKRQVAAEASEWMKANEAATQFLFDNSKWSDFYRSLLEKLNRYGHLTENQLAAVHKGMAAQREREIAHAQKTSSAPVVDKLIAAFNAAKETKEREGLKRYPKLVFGETKLAMAADHSKNPGHVYVTESGEYCGKITPAGKFLPTRNCPDEVIQRIYRLGEDVLDEAISYGKKSGRCCCCNRKLDNDVSILAGVGPICAENWGLTGIRKHVEELQRAAQ